MFALRIESGGRTSEARFAGAEAVLGSDPSAGVRRDDAGWAAVEGWAWHAGTTLVVVRGDGSKPETLRVGDSLRLGRALVTLTGLVPLVEGEEGQEGDGGGRTPRPTAPVGGAPVASPAPALPRRAKPARSFSGATFGEEMFGRLRRAPWFALSAALHLAVGFLLSIVLPARPPLPPPDGPRLAMLESAFGADEPVEHLAPEDVPEPPAPDPLALARPEPVVLHESDAEPPLPAPEPEMLEPAERLEAPPLLLGTSGSLVSKRNGRAAAPPAEEPPALVSDTVNHDHEKGDEHNRRAAAVVLESVRRRGGSLARVLAGLRPEHVLVVRGTFDEMERTLDALGLPYTPRSPGDVGDDHDYGAHKIVFWGCGEFPTRARRPAIAAGLRAFVKGGGYLFTSDWMISNLLVEAFPSYLATSGRERPLPEAVLDVRPGPGVERHALLEGVFLPGTQAKWWIEASSHDVQVKDASRVETLIESPMLATASFGERSPAVAVTFAYGRGRVLHTLGHYFQKEGNLSGTIAAQRIALNFVRLRLGRDDEDVR